MTKTTRMVSALAFGVVALSACGTSADEEETGTETQAYATSPAPLLAYTFDKSCYASALANGPSLVPMQMTKMPRPDCVLGLNGCALHIPGSSARADVPIDAATGAKIVASQQMSLSLWVRPSSVYPGMPVLWRDAATGSADVPSFRLEVSSTGLWRFCAAAGAMNACATSKSNHPAVNDVQKWTQIGAVVDAKGGSMNVQLYIDGAPQDGGPTLPGALTNPGTPLTIGSRSNGNTTSSFNGVVDEVALYANAFTALQMKSIYDDMQKYASAKPQAETFTACAAPSTPPSLAYTFDDPASCISLVRSGNVTIGGGPTCEHARIGCALRLDGKSDRVSFAHDAKHLPSGAMTLSLWFAADELPNREMVLIDKPGDVRAGDDVQWERYSVALMPKSPTSPHQLVRFRGTYVGKAKDGQYHPEQAQTFEVYGVWQEAEVGKWVHVAAVLDPDTRLARVFVNGEAVNSIGEATESALTSPPEWSDKPAIKIGPDFATLKKQEPPLTIGARGKGFSTSLAYSNHFAGRIDEIRIYPLALSGSSIDDLGATPPPIKPVNTACAVPAANQATTDFNASCGTGPTAPTCVDAPSGCAGSFGGFDPATGTGDVLVVNHAPIQEPTGGTSLSAWVDLDTLGDEQVIAEKVSVIGDKSESPYRLLVRKAPGGAFSQFVFEVRIAGGTQRVAWPEAPGQADAPHPNEWMHVTGVYDGSALKLFVNGRPVKAAEVTGYVDIKPTVAAALKPLLVGAGFKDYSAATKFGYKSHFDGLIDNVLVHNVALRDDQVWYLASRRFDDSPKTSCAKLPAALVDVDVDKSCSVGNLSPNGMSCVSHESAYGCGMGLDGKPLTFAQLFAPASGPFTVLTRFTTEKLTPQSADVISAGHIKVQMQDLHPNGATLGVYLLDLVNAQGFGGAAVLKAALDKDDVRTSDGRPRSLHVGLSVRGTTPTKGFLSLDDVVLYVDGLRAPLTLTSGAYKGWQLPLGPLKQDLVLGSEAFHGVMHALTIVNGVLDDGQIKAHATVNSQSPYLPTTACK